MTTVWISHNPFLVETEIIIDDLPIAETSRLYKYIKTPMQNWVSNFLPTLVEHCNDDELNIIFKGLPHNYEDLALALKAFLEKNRDYEIALQFDACPSQFERLERLNAIAEKVDSQSHLLEFPSHNISKAPANSLAVLVFGGNNIRRSKLIEALSNHSSVSDKFCPLSIREMDSNYESVEQSITSDEQPILICLLDENTGNKANARIMNLISDSYKVRSKFHKWRFIFVADNPQYAKRILSSDFAIKNVDVYASDDFSRISRQIDEYRNEVCLVHHLADSADKLALHLSDLKQTLDTQAEQATKTEEINVLEQKALSIVSNCSLVLTVSAEDQIDAFIQQLNRSFTDYCCFRTDVSTLITETAAIGRVKIYIRDILSERIRDFLQKQAANIKYSMKLDIAKPTPDFGADTVANILQQFGCKSLLYFIKEYAESKEMPIPTYTYPPVQGYLSKISALTMRVSVFSFRRHLDFIKFASEYAGREYGSEIIFDFYDGLRALICKDLSSTSPMSTSKKTHCSTQFQNQISKTKPILQAHLISCQSSAAMEAKKVSRNFDKMLLETKKEIADKANEMRKKVQISEEQKKRLEIVEQLLKQAEALTSL